MLPEDAAQTRVAIFVHLRSGLTVAVVSVSAVQHIAAVMSQEGVVTPVPPDRVIILISLQEVRALLSVDIVVAVVALPSRSSPEEIKSAAASLTSVPPGPAPR